MNEKPLEGARALTVWALIFRGMAVVWIGVTTATCFHFAVARPSSFSLEEGWPIYAVGAPVSLFFCVALMWGPWVDIRRWMPRVLLLLRWLVASGALLAFSIAVAARVELFVPFGILGVVLLLNSVTLVGLSLVSVGLNHRYEVAQRLAEDERRRTEHAELLEATRDAGRPWWRRPDRRTRS